MLLVHHKLEKELADVALRQALHTQPAALEDVVGDVLAVAEEERVRGCPYDTVDSLDHIGGDRRPLFDVEATPRDAVDVDRVMPYAANKALAAAKLDDPIAALDKPAAGTRG